MLSFKYRVLKWVLWGMGGQKQTVTSLALDTVSKNGPWLPGPVKLWHKAWASQSQSLLWKIFQHFPLHPTAAVLFFSMASYSWQTTWAFSCLFFFLFFFSFFLLFFLSLFLPFSLSFFLFNSPNLLFLALGVLSLYSFYIASWQQKRLNLWDKKLLISSTVLLLLVWGLFKAWSAQAL